MGDKLAGKSIAMIHPENTGQGHLDHHGKNLDGQDNENRPVAGLYNFKCEVFGNVAEIKNAHRKMMTNSGHIVLSTFKNVMFVKFPVASTVLYKVII